MYSSPPWPWTTYRTLPPLVSNVRTRSILVTASMVNRYPRRAARRQAFGSYVASDAHNFHQPSLGAVASGPRTEYGVGDNELNHAVLRKRTLQ